MTTKENAYVSIKESITFSNSLRDEAEEYIKNKIEEGYITNWSETNKYIIINSKKSIKYNNTQDAIKNAALILKNKKLNEKMKEQQLDYDIDI